MIHQLLPGQRMIVQGKKNDKEFSHAVVCYEVDTGFSLRSADKLEDLLPLGFF